jgi:hypothetical protein
MSAASQPPPQRAAVAAIVAKYFPVDKVPFGQKALERVVAAANTVVHGTAKRDAIAAYAATLDPDLGVNAMRDLVKVRAQCVQRY